MTKRIGLAALWALLLMAHAAQASYPCGIYARIDAVEVGPDPDKPTWVKVWGDFVLVKTSNRLVGPDRGYMYFSLVEKKEEHCRIEWKDLREIARTTKYVAFGSALSEIRDDLADSGNRANVHKKESKDAKPIPYPLNHGMSRLRTNRDLFDGDNNPVVLLQKYLKEHPLEKP